ncbi:hypothetical protein, unlikely [Trypanosoma congolense IL3000]|uniref:Uncharacterized protein n=1 Tax=Trypanosoma congolense (strain IL3000) TaxID=1068625 RepID=F9WFH2_TRYCI|nr:hypothetical protein, unlikely [Trypanosoma congolense IL3000]
MPEIHNALVEYQCTSRREWSLLFMIACQKCVGCLQLRIELYGILEARFGWSLLHGLVRKTGFNLLFDVFDLSELLCDSCCSVFESLEGGEGFLDVRDGVRRGCPEGIFSSGCLVCDFAWTKFAPFYFATEAFPNSQNPATPPERIV